MYIFTKIKQTISKKQIERKEMFMKKAILIIISIMTLMLTYISIVNHVC